jgi:hypothetical protein
MAVRVAGIPFSPQHSLIADSAWAWEDSSARLIRRFTTVSRVRAFGRSDTYNTNTYPEVLKTMARFIDGTPKVQTSEVVNSTFHKIAAGVSA